MNDKQACQYQLTKSLILVIIKNNINQQPKPLKMPPVQWIILKMNPQQEVKADWWLKKTCIGRRNIYCNLINKINKHLGNKKSVKMRLDECLLWGRLF